MTRCRDSLHKCKSCKRWRIAWMIPGNVKKESNYSGKISHVPSQRAVIPSPTWYMEFFLNTVKRFWQSTSYVRFITDALARNSSLYDPSARGAIPVQVYAWMESKLLIFWDLVFEVFHSSQNRLNNTKGLEAQGILSQGVRNKEETQFFLFHFFILFAKRMCESLQIASIRTRMSTFSSKPLSQKIGEKVRGEGFRAQSVEESLFQYAVRGNNWQLLWIREPRKKLHMKSLQKFLQPTWIHLLEFGISLWSWPWNYWKVDTNLGVLNRGTLNRGRNLCVTVAIVVDGFHGTSGIERGKGFCYQWKAKWQCSRGDPWSFQHESNDRAKPTP